MRLTDVQVAHEAVRSSDERPEIWKSREEPRAEV